MGIDRRWFILLVLGMLGGILYMVALGPNLSNISHVAIPKSHKSYELEAVDAQPAVAGQAKLSSKLKRRKKNKQKYKQGNGKNREAVQQAGKKLQGIALTMQKRKDLLNEECPNTNERNLYTKDEYFYRWMFVNTELNMVGCAIPKVGSTYMKRLTSPNHDSNPNFNKEERPTMEKFKPTKKKYIFNTYKKFLMVRDPYDRLWSAYTSKILQARDGEFQLINRDIIKTIRKTLSKKEKKCSDDVSFFEFVRYIIYCFRRNIDFNPHWETYRRLCHPCMVDYDIILHLENFDSEVHYLLDSVGVEESQQKLWTYSSSSVDSMIEAACRLNTKMRCQDIDEIVEKNYQYLSIEGVVDPVKDREEIMPLLKSWIIKGKSQGCVETFKRKFAAYSEKDRAEIIKSRKRQVRIKAYAELGEKEHQMLQEIYEADFKLFGYNPKFGTKSNNEM